MLSHSTKDQKDNRESPEFLIPEQVRVGTNLPITHAERLAFLKSSGIARLLGFHNWYNDDESDNNQNSTELEVQKSQNNQ